MLSSDIIDLHIGLNFGKHEYGIGQVNVHHDLIPDQLACKCVASTIPRQVGNFAHRIVVPR